MVPNIGNSHIFVSKTATWLVISIIYSKNDQIFLESSCLLYPYDQKRLYFEDFEGFVFPCLLSLLEDI